MIYPCPNCQKRFDYQKQFRWTPPDMDCPYCGLRLKVKSKLQPLMNFGATMGIPLILLVGRLDNTLAQHFIAIPVLIFYIVLFYYQRRVLVFEVAPKEDTETS